MSKVREAMVPEPRTLDAEAPVTEAGELLARPEVRAIFVCDGGRLLGVVTRKTLVREVVAPGLDPKETSLGAIAEEPYYTLDSDMDLDALGEQMAARKEQLMAEIETAGLPEPETTSLEKVQI